MPFLAEKITGMLYQMLRMVGPKELKEMENLSSEKSA
jgi:hypothetical protein